MNNDKYNRREYEPKWLITGSSSRGSLSELPNVIIYFAHVFGCIWALIRFLLHTIRCKHHMVLPYWLQVSWWACSLRRNWDPVFVWASKNILAGVTTVWWIKVTLWANHWLPLALFSLRCGFGLNDHLLTPFRYKYIKKIIRISFC